MQKRILFVGLMAAALMAVSAAWGESTTVLLEKGIYAEETKGDLDEAITIYEQIISKNQASREYVASAYYRLGSCYLKKGDGPRAVQAFKDLVQHFPDQEEWVSEAKVQLAKLGIQNSGADVGQQDSQPLQIGSAPWTSGEVCRYKLQNPAGVDIGNMIWTAESDRIEGRDVWRIEEYLSVLANNTTQYSRVDADTDSLAPLFGRTKNSLGDFRAVYGSDSISLETDVSGKRTQKEIPVVNVAYDNEQVIYLIRRLPLAEGYKASFPLFTAQEGALARCEIQVTGMEKIEVPAGAFSCYRMTLTVRSGDADAVQHTLWYSADRDRVLVKYDSGQVVIVLEGVVQRQAGAPVEFTDEELGITITPPVGWYFCKAALPGNSPYTLMMQILSPEMRTWALFTTAKIGAVSIPSIRQIAEGDIPLIKSYYKDYVVRPENWVEQKISGLPTAGFTADYSDKGRKMVEYRRYILGESQLYWFVFRIETDAFETQKVEYDNMIRSFIGR